MVGTLVVMAAAIVLALVPGANPLVLVIALAGPSAMGVHMVWQLRQLDVENGPLLLFLFRSNRNAGLIPLAFLCVAILM